MALGTRTLMTWVPSFLRCNTSIAAPLDALGRGTRAVRATPRTTIQLLHLRLPDGLTRCLFALRQLVAKLFGQPSQCSRKGRRGIHTLGLRPLPQLLEFSLERGRHPEPHRFALLLLRSPHSHCHSLQLPVAVC